MSIFERTDFIDKRKLLSNAARAALEHWLTHQSWCWGSAYNGDHPVCNFIEEIAQAKSDRALIACAAFVKAYGAWADDRRGTDLEMIDRILARQGHGEESLVKMEIDMKVRAEADDDPVFGEKGAA